MSYVNERLRSESSYIKNNFLKINSFIDILSNVVETIERLVLYKEPSCLKCINFNPEALQPTKEQGILK